MIVKVETEDIIGCKSMITWTMESRLKQLRGRLWYWITSRQTTGRLTWQRGAFGHTNIGASALADLTLVHFSEWRAPNVGLHGAFSNSAIRQRETPTSLTTLVLKCSYGLLWIRARAI
jgi:hypothetical protein